MRIKNDDDVIEVDFKHRCSLELKEPTPGGGCRHLKLKVDAEMRTVECSLCGVVLDPVQVLIDFARKERKLGYTHQAMKDARGRLRNLEDEERRIKSRIRRAEKKLKGV